MSYQPAYTTSFRSHDNTLWEIAVYIDDYDAHPLEISLEGDEPCVIEWQETGKTDVVQPSSCTLCVSNESDRQMAQLMTHPDAAVIVSRNGKWYWFGHLDDAVYEEPYSFAKAYVTELHFTDFGRLNRIPFTLRGKQSVEAIVRHCLESIGYGSVALDPYTYISLLDPKTHQPIRLGDLYINADRFKPDDESWDGMTTQRQVLEETLRPLGLRIMQKNGQIYIYDIEYLRDHDNFHNYIIWKGTDAYLRGSETFGWYEVAFGQDAVETVAESDLPIADIDLPPERYCALYYDEDEDQILEGFYVSLPHYLGPDGALHMGYRSRSGLSSADDVGYPWRVHAAYTDLHVQIPSRILHNEYVRYPVAQQYGSAPVASAIFSIKSGYLPLVPDRDKFQLRVNLDLLLSLLVNPAESPEDWNVNCFGYGFGVHNYRTRWKEMMLRAYVPVKLELLDENGNALMHYSNTFFSDPYTPCPLRPGLGTWKVGAASFGDMLLAYYNDGHESTPFEGWATNRQTISADAARQPLLYKNREQGEYVPLPPVAGILRLTVSNCIYSKPGSRYSYYPLDNLLKWLNWQVYRNPEITLVRANRVDDGIDTDDIRLRYMRDTYGDSFSETLQAGSWCRGSTPTARGLFFRADGSVWEKFTKNGWDKTLERHRLSSIEDQTSIAQPVISGTAELNATFCAYRELSTPGVFLVTAIRQNLHLGTEEVTMARIANVGGTHYDFSWSNAVCVKEEPPGYDFFWINPICATEKRTTAIDN